MSDNIISPVYSPVDIEVESKVRQQVVCTEELKFSESVVPNSYLSIATKKTKAASTSTNILSDLREGRPPFDIEYCSPDDRLNIPSANLSRSVSFNENLLSPDSGLRDKRNLYRPRSSVETFTDRLPITLRFKRLMSSTSKQPDPSPNPSGGSSGSSKELNRSTSFRKIGSSLARKISRRGRSPSSLNASEEAEGEQDVFKQAIMSATAASNGRVGGDPTLVCYKELLKLFQCPACQTLMSPPLPQCRKGHIVCSSCKLAAKNVCPICKQRFAETNNFMMEQVYQVLRLPCRFSPQGCPELIVLRQKGEHESYCSFRPVPCHYTAEGCPKVLPFKDIQTHIPQCEFRAVHKNTKLK